MEHRCNRRFSTRCNVVIHTSNGAVVSGTAQNLSRGGLYLHTDCPGAFTKNRVVKLAVQTRQQLLIIPSLVVRQDGNAVALMFIEDVAASTQILDTLLDAGVREQRQVRVASF